MEKQILAMTVIYEEDDFKSSSRKRRNAGKPMVLVRGKLGRGGDRRVENVFCDCMGMGKGQ